jgi:hypothetical protein
MTAIREPDPLPDIPRLRKVVEWVEEQSALPRESREWDQSLWHANLSCGTVCCVAGKLAEDMGADIRDDEYGSTVFDGKNPYEFGADLLGATPAETHRLFSTSNDAAAVRAAAEAIAERVGERL